MKLQIYGKSVKGKDHKENEDAFLINKRKNLFAVADGVSNPPGGREAAIKSLNYLNKFFKNNLHEAIKKTNIKIIEEKKKNPKIGYTTLTAVNIKNNNLEMAHIGDSSLFLIEENKIKKLTVSH
ncbi:MAG: protein phosphatase 2C domain-containing protein [Candidatus Aenigmatarchaeota archaeon]